MLKIQLTFTKKELEAMDVDYYDETMLRTAFDDYVDETVPNPKLMTEWGTFSLSSANALWEVDGGDRYIECFKIWMREQLDEGVYVNVSDTHDLFIKNSDYLLLSTKMVC